MCVRARVRVYTVYTLTYTIRRTSDRHEEQSVASWRAAGERLRSLSRDASGYAVCHLIQNDAMLVYHRVMPCHTMPCNACLTPCMLCVICVHIILCVCLWVHTFEYVQYMHDFSICLITQSSVGHFYDTYTYMHACTRKPFVFSHA